MGLSLYWGSGSQPSWRVMLALEIKKLEYESKLLSFSKGEHMSPEFLRMNPRHKVPAIVDDGFVLYESLAILEYLDRKYPAVPLFGTTAKEAGIIHRHVSEFFCYFEPPAMNYVRPLFFGNQDEHRSTVESAIPTIKLELAELEEKLRTRPGRWLLGETVSAADICFYPTLKALERAASKRAADQFELQLLPLQDHHPTLATWMQQFEELPGYERTYPPHWRES